MTRRREFAKLRQVRDVPWRQRRGRSREVAIGERDLSMLVVGFLDGDLRYFMLELGYAGTIEN